MKAGKRVFLWHHWCGLIVGIFLLIMSISGAILAFSDEIEGSYESKWLKVSNSSGAVSYDASFFSIQQRFPNWEVRLYGTPGANEAIVYDLRKGSEIQKVFVHPTTGQVLHLDKKVDQQLHRQLLTLHYTFYAGTTGKIIVFFVGGLFFLTLLTGIYLYRKALLKVILFKIRMSRKTGRSFYSSLHRIIGVWSLLFNLLIVVTGLFISGNIVLSALKKTAPKNETKQIAFRSIDSLRQELQKKHPAFNVHLIRIAANSNTIQFSGNFKGEPFYYGNYYSRFYFNGSTGSLEKKEWLKEQSSFKKWQSIVAPLHFGNYGGLPVKALYSLFGLLPGLLSITGFLIWRKRKKIQQKGLTA